MTTRYHPPMASKAGGSMSPKTRKSGATFVKSSGGTAVQPARDRGENRAIPIEHCVSKRKAFETSYGGSAKY